MNIVIFGPPGAGKGTQADNLVKDLNLFKVSTGDLLRKEIEKKTTLGVKIKSIIDKGKLIRQDEISGIREEIKKTEIKLSLRVKDFKTENAKILNKKNGVSVISQKEIGKHTQLTLKLKEKMIPWVTDNLVSDGVKIFSIEPHRNSLEDVFLKETGSENS